MKIAIICTLYPPHVLGGAEISVSLLAESFVTLGNEVIVITTGKDYRKETIKKVLVYRLKNKNIYWRYPQREKPLFLKTLWHALDIYNPFYKSSIKKILEDFKPDIVNTSNLCGLSTSVWNVVHGLKIPLVHTLRDYYLLCPQQTMTKSGHSCEKQCTICKSYSAVKKKMSQNVDALVGISDFIAQQHMKFRYFTNAQKVVTIANSVNKVVNIQRSKTNCIGFIGRLSPEKGIEFMIECFKKSEISKSYKLLIAGNGNKKYENLLKNKYSSKNVLFIGHEKQSAFFHNIDWLVVPSLWNEPFGRVVIEAYASHCPVLMSTNGGLLELQTDGISWSFDTQTPNNLIKLFNGISNDLITVDDCVFDIETDKYNKEFIARKYLSLFSDILKNKSL